MIALDVIRAQDIIGKTNCAENENGMCKKSFFALHLIGSQTLIKH